jgi:hypothetical protein
MKHISALDELHHNEKKKRQIKTVKAASQAKGSNTSLL